LIPGAPAASMLELGEEESSNWSKGLYLPSPPLAPEPGTGLGLERMRRTLPLNYGLLSDLLEQVVIVNQAGGVAIAGRVQVVNAKP
jgi:hypothetical protein